MTAVNLRQMLAAGGVSCVDVMRSILAEIDRREPVVRAFITLRNPEELLAEAADVDRRRLRGHEIGALCGLPVAVKDNLSTKGIRTTCASRMLGRFQADPHHPDRPSYLPPYDATVVEKIKAADGIILGKTNMDEFAMGSSTENSASHLTTNPHDPSHVAGGSSGGSAAAVAAHESILALGSDTGGSIRQPASFCGVVGLKPTYGRVSRFGLVAYGSSLDQVGPLAKTVDDAALLLSVIAGHDPRDSTSLDAPVPDYSPGGVPPRKLRIGIPHECFQPGMDPEVKALVDSTLALLEQAGHQLVPVKLPHTEYAIPTYYIIACAEASANLARFDGVRFGHRASACDDVVAMYSRTRAEGFGDEVKRRIILGTYVLSSGYHEAFYLRALKVRSLISRDFARAFEACDVIAHPVAPTPAYRIGEKSSDPLAMYLGDIYSVTANLAGLPAMSVPCGTTRANLPVGIQFTAKPLDEPILLHAGREVEAAMNPHHT